jgi:apolipoprotein N-acyltransferase
MLNILLSKCSLVWLLLMAITLLSWLLQSHQPFAEATVPAAIPVSGVAMLLLAFFKVRLVMMYFMEVKHAPLQLRTVCEAWVAIGCTSLIWLYTGYSLL